MIPTTPPHPRDAFPRPDLMGELIKNYFTHLNNILPLIHRPTFERNMEANLHLSDETFGSIVLMVCAIGSRFSDDRTVLPPKTDKWEWAGWHWFQRVRAVRQLVQLSSPQYQDLQVSCVRAASPCLDRKPTEKCCLSPDARVLRLVISRVVRSICSHGSWRASSSGHGRASKEHLQCDT